MKENNNSNIISKGDILIVDDSKVLLETVVEILQTENYSTIAVDSGRAAMAYLSKNKPDLILLDRTMEDINGFEVCKWIKKKKEIAKIPVIFLTASTDLKSIVEGFDIGAVDYITKPFQKEELLARVNSHIQLYHATEMIKKQSIELKENEKTLRELNATKDKFFAIIAHDLKGPLGNMQQIGILLKDNCLDNNKLEVFRLTEFLVSITDNTIKLLEDLMTWATFHRGKIVFEPKEVTIQKVVAENIELLGSLAHTKSITITNKIDRNATVYVDLNMLNAILRNLFSNALKFTSKNGNVTITGRLIKNDYYEVSVKDSGIGMNLNQINNLFKLDKVKSTNGTDGEQGSGLGLIICKEFIEINGGKIWVKSEPDKGSDFRFKLPVANNFKI